MFPLCTQASCQVSWQWFNQFPSEGTGATSEHTIATSLNSRNGGAGEPWLFLLCKPSASCKWKGFSFTVLGTRCRCVSDAQFNEWSKVEKPDTLNYLFIQWNETAWREMERGTLELGIKGSPSLWPVKLIIRHYHWSQKVEGIQKRMSCLLRKCKCLVISQKTLKTKYKPSCFRWLPNLKIIGE